ncbi:MULTISPECIES: hypothetical protein [unclassified Acinetobacter]|uniref:hypothetical protein n=1 Tax=unclassified Acinetobacter TaxID=196816 RepID=UPI0024471FB3|nr:MULTISPECIES: hypothetical protein [unclassified Acinetobacter]MDH0032908.1 hypothetical protein [Acinetobacter sp. GD04021]MDH0887303.1 hypothetical protein [Acinetobacter sp. GD03873]MDH1084699.1 hypothetical protein [Acinetobacter sp. GD03983]MDH2190619.1 hypothetical protein [Acinetobacter sp. GD03645]MDH2205087.1 hypothetical protein [Acinetobacter sp. GD03647]
MFGTNGPFNKTLNQPTVLRDFDSAAAGITTSVNTLTSAMREELSFIEHVRETALHIVSDLVNAVSDGTLDEDELPTDRLDALIIDALDGADDEDGTYENALIASIDDAFSTFGVDDSVIQEIFSDNVDAADAAIEAAASTVIANMPDEGDPLDELIREFIYGEPDEVEDGFDSANKSKRLSKAEIKARVGAFSQKKVNGRKVAYRGVLAIRKGVRAIVNKRLPGQKVRLSAAQKAGLKKARLHAYTANALKKKVKSFKKGRNMGFY